MIKYVIHPKSRFAYGAFKERDKILYLLVFILPRLTMERIEGYRKFGIGGVDIHDIVNSFLRNVGEKFVCDKFLLRGEDSDTTAVIYILQNHRADKVCFTRTATANHIYMSVPH